jgi:hypothetical protein
MPIKSTISRVAFCGIQLVQVRQPAEDILPLWMYVEEEIVGIESSFGGNRLIYLYVLLLQPSDEAVHLGLKRTSKNECEINILDRFKVAKTTTYAFMRSGVHGTNGLDPKTSYQLYNTYVLPRLYLDVFACQ